MTWHQVFFRAKWILAAKWLHLKKILGIHKELETEQSGEQLELTLDTHDHVDMRQPLLEQMRTARIAEQIAEQKLKSRGIEQRLTELKEFDRRNGLK